MGIVRGGDQNYTQTHTHTDAHFISLDFLRKCRNKTKKAKLFEMRCFKSWPWLLHHSRLLMCRVITLLENRASQILHVATDGCHSRPWLACWPPSGDHTDAAPKHSLCYFSCFRVDGHVHQRIFAKRRFWLLLDVGQSFSLSPNCAGIRHRSSWKLYSIFASCFRTRLSAFHICIVNIHTFTQWEFLSRYVANSNNHNHYTYSTNV